MKKFIIVTACIVSLGLVAIGVQQYQATAGDTSISMEEAKQIATERYPGTVTEVERERERGKEVYEIEITDEEYAYELKLDADSGEIIKLDEKEKINKNKQQVNQSHEDHNASTPSEKNNNQANTINQQGGYPISMKDAIRIALAEADGTVKEAELDTDDGFTYYEIEIDTNRGEVEIEVNAYTGEIIQISYDD